MMPYYLVNVTLTLKLDLLLKNFNLGSFVRVATLRESSSDNSYWLYDLELLLIIVAFYLVLPPEGYVVFLTTLV